jgi:hypothetical protein
MVPSLRQHMPPCYRPTPVARQSNGSPPKALEEAWKVPGSGATMFRVGTAAVARLSDTDDLDCCFSRVERWMIALLGTIAALVIVGTGAAEMWVMR